MAERLSGAWPHQLDGLLERLRQQGFSIGVPETVRVHQLLLALVERGVPLESAERWASLLGPVLCRSASEQEAFGRHVREWWPGPVLLEPEAEPAPAAADLASDLEQALEAVEQRRARTLRWLPVAPLLAAATAGLVAAAVLGVQLLQRRPEPTKPPTPGPVVAPQTAPTPSGAPAIKAQPERQPLPPQPPSVVLPGRDQALLLLPSELALLTLLAALFSAAAVQGAVRGWWWRQARLVLQRLPLQGDPQLHRIALEAIEPDLVGLPELHRIGRALNGWQRLPSAELDATATVEASVRQGGWLIPRYGERRERLSYLFFLDQDSLADQQTRHLRAWLERLRQEGVLADWVCFQRQPLLCRGPSGHGPLRRLPDLVALHPDAVAVVVADGERFFSPVDGTPEAWIEALAAWPRRLVLTPRPQARWGAAEQELQELLPVLPVSVEGLLGLGRLLQGAPVGPLPAEAQLAPAPEPPLLRGSSTPWLDRSPPSPAVVRQLRAQLRAHLGPEGFLWLAACAVFPELHWTITAYLGQRLHNAAGEPLLRHCPLLRLARLPWLRHGVMPDWLRLPLILALDGPQQAAVRQVLGQLLLSAAEGEEVSAAQLQVATGSSQRLPRLLPPLLEQLRRRASPTSPLHDQLFLRFLQNRPLLAADAPESLRRLLPPRAAGLGPRGLAASTLLLLALGGLGLVAVRQVQLAWIDQLLVAPAEDVAGAPATQRLQRAITALGLSRSSLMRLGPDPDLRGVEGALAKGVMQSSAGPPLKGHEDWVRSVAISPDGRQIVSGSYDRTVRVWDALAAPDQATLSANQVAAALPWQRTLPIACRRLALHPSLHDLPWLNTARATCRHFTGLPEPEPPAGLVASLRPWLLPAGAGLGAAGLVLAQRRRLRRLGQLRPFGFLEGARKPKPPKPAPSPPPALELRPLTLVSAQLHRRGGPWQVERREVTVQGVEEPLGNGLSLRLIQIPAGSFPMGSPKDEPDRNSTEGPQYEVTIEEFFMGQTPITQAQWREVASWQQRQGERWDRELELEPSFFKPRPNPKARNFGPGRFSLGQDETNSDQRPVDNVSWHDAIEFCNRLSQRTGRHYTLPSEAQWEYACRAGTTTAFAFGATLSAELANYNATETYGDGPKGEYRKQTTPVGLFPANAWGLHDMHGNVLEWCLDHWYSSYEGAPSDGSAWLKPSAWLKASAWLKPRASDVEGRLLRGGSWYSLPRDCRSAYRYRYQPGYAYDGVGFRVVCLPQDPSLNP